MHCNVGDLADDCDSEGAAFCAWVLFGGVTGGELFVMKEGAWVYREALTSPLDLLSDIITLQSSDHTYTHSSISLQYSQHPIFNLNIPYFNFHPPLHQHL